MTNKRLAIGNIQLRATDGLILGALTFFSLLTIIFFFKIEGWWLVMLKNIIVALVYLAFNYLSEHTDKKFWKFFLRMASIVLAYAYLFGAVAKLQFIIHDHWLDDYVLDMEQYIYGVQPTLWLQDYISKPLTEWMMFAYVIYIPMYPVLCGIIFYLRGELAMEDYFFTLGFTNILCDLGFILFPVAGPLPHIGSLYTVPLDGYICTWLGELIRHNVHYIGGTIPSPHAAAATIMWIMAYRYHRLSFWILSPVVLSLYISTFYGRYHYVTDAIVGIAVAFIGLALAPMLMKAWDMLVDRSAVSST